MASRRSSAGLPWSRRERSAAGHSSRGLRPRHPEQSGASLVLPKRYIAYLFDDIHLEFGDLAQVRNAADRHFQTLLPTDRAAIFTTSGQTQLDFTDDRAKLHETLNRILPRSLIAETGTTECPNVTYYMADQIQNNQDDRRLRTATQDARRLPAMASHNDGRAGSRVTGQHAAIAAAAAY